MYHTWRSHIINLTINQFSSLPIRKGINIVYSIILFLWQCHITTSFNLSFLRFFEVDSIVFVEDAYIPGFNVVT